MLANHRIFSSNLRKGFTVVELLIVIVVIGILAGIVIVSYSGWRHSTATNAVKSDLIQAASAMESAKNFGSGYPSYIPSDSFTPSANNSIVLVTSTPTSFCINGTTTSDATIQYYITDTSNGTPQPGNC